MSDDRPATVTLPRRVWVLALLGLGGMLAVLGVMLATQFRQLEHIRSQDHRAAAQYDLSKGVLRDVRPLVAALREARPDLRRLARRAEVAAVEGSELARQLDAADADQAIAATGELAVELLRGDRLARLIDRSTHLVDRSTRTLDLVDRLDAVERGARAAQSVPRVERAARELLAIQKLALDILRQSLEVQRQTLRHAASLDRKLGGTPPPGGG